MKLNKRLLVTSSCIILGFGSIVIAPLTVVSCSSTKSSNYGKTISELTTQYRTKLASVVKAPSEFYQYTSTDVPALTEICNEYLNQANELLNNEKEMNIDEKIWLKSLIDEITVKKQIIESKIHLLIVDKYDRLAFTNYSGVLSNSINTAFRNFGNKIKQNQQDALDYLNEFTTYINKIKTNLEEGKTNDITMSGVMYKHSLGNLLQSCFNELLQDFSLNNKKQTIQDLENKNLLPFTKIAKQANISEQQTLDKIKEIDTNLMNFVGYLTDYYKEIKYGKSDLAGTAYTLTVVNSKPTEEDNGFNYNGKYISGLGLSNVDLQTKDIGIGFTPNVDGYGKKIYEALLRKHSSTTNTAKEIFDIGNNAVMDIKNNMKEVAKTVAKVYVGDNQAWSASGEYYDKDSSGNQFGAVNADSLLTNIVDAAGNVDLSKFFIWMNTNRWFNGRDMREDQYPTINGVDPIYAKYYNASGANPITNWQTSSRNTPYIYEAQFEPKTNGITGLAISDVMGSYVDYMDENFVINKNLDNVIATTVDGDAGNLAYKYLVLGLSPSTVQESNTITNIEQTNSISPEAAFIGTSKAINQYLQFKDKTVEHIAGMFKETSFDYTLRSGVGGAAYANGGDGSWQYSNKGWGGFYLDTNPYYGLQKWSMSTLSSHEAVSGHVFQFNYAHDHPAVDYAPSFDVTAYAEGWGLFAEWLAVQAGLYGEPVIINDASDSQLAVPKFGINSKNIDVKQFKNKDDYANGAYWVDDDKTTSDVDPGNSQTLFDAVQYFGFLNERQLRAMRCAVDVGIHGGGATINAQGDVTDSTSAGQFKKGTGWSLEQAREYLQKNSGLGLDDIKRETKRYLEYTGQAVSYYNGTVAIQKLYVDAAIKYTNTYQENFLNWQDTILSRKNTEGLFDIILRNGDVPIDVLTWAIEDYISNNYNNY